MKTLKMYRLHLLFLMAILYGMPDRVQAQSHGVSNSGGHTLNASTDIVGVNEYTGAASVAIPILSKVVDGMDVGIDISSSLSGRRYEEIASSVGLGWMLNAGGIISRTAKGLPDETYMDQNGICEGYWHRNNLDLKLYSDPVNDPGKSMGDFAISQGINDGVVDGQTDHFQLNFNGRQIRFLFSYTGEIVTFPADVNVRIQRIINGVNVDENTSLNFPSRNYINSFGFIVRDESGNQLYFKEGDISVINFEGGKVQYWGSSGGETIQYPTNWVLDKIITNSGKEIRYTYLNSGFTWRYTGVNQAFSYVANPLPMNNQDCGIDQESERNEYGESAYYGSYLFIKTIEYPDLVATFNYYDEDASWGGNGSRCDLRGAFALEEIVLTPRHTLLGTEKKFTFHSNYSTTDDVTPYHVCCYHPSGGTPPCTDAHTGPSPYYIKGTTSGDLILHSVTETSNGQSQPLYAFEYYYNNNVPVSPYVLGKDHWGYIGIRKPSFTYYTWSDSNGTHTEQKPVVTPVFTYAPSHTYGSEIYVSPVSPATGSVPVSVTNASDHILNNTLKKISTGTRASITFEFENNQINSNFLMNGLRIRRIISDPGIANLPKTVKSYSYADPEWNIPLMGSSPSFNDLYKRDIELRCQSNVYAGNTEMLSNWLGEFDELPSGYGEVTVELHNEYFDPGQNAVVSDLVEKKEVKFSRLTNTTNMNHFTVIGSAKDNQSYTSPFVPNSFILNPPPNGAPATYFTQTNDNYCLGYNADPKTFKTYYPFWALGMPTHIKMYDKFGSLQSETDYEYDIQVKAINTPEFLNCNIKQFRYEGTNVNPLPADYHYDYYYPYTGKIVMKKNLMTQYISPTQSTQTEILFEPDLYGNMKKTTTKLLNTGIEFEDLKLYNTDYPANSLFSSMASDGLHYMVGTEIWKKENGVKTLQQATGTGYILNPVNSLYYVPKYVYSLKGLSPVPQAAYPSGSFDFVQAAAGTAPGHFKKGRTIEKLDRYNYPVQVRDDGAVQSTIYDVDQDLPLAIVSQALHEEIAFTGFESLYDDQPALSADYNNRNKGNWDFASEINLSPGSFSCVHATKSFTGSLSLQYDVSGLGQPNTMSLNSVTNLVTGKEYILSFWRYHAGNTLQAAALRNGTQVLMPVVLRTVHKGNDDWELVQCKFTATAPSVEVELTSPSVFIDELRLYPYESTIHTLSYDPVWGKTAECDNVNEVIFYEYDALGRLILTRDTDYNILSKTQNYIQEND